uniref:ribonuclease H n=1 Tax=Maylandia zebra TaxID=106582 RepID=A0A3P9C5M7_9CICH
MDSADQNTIGQALAAQEAALTRHEQMLHQLRGEIAALTQAVSGLTTPGGVQPGTSQPPRPAQQETLAAATAGPSSAATPSSDGPLPSPEPFSGETEKCSGFLAQCSLIFREQRRFHNNDGAKIAFLVQMLRDRALKWAQVVLNSNPEISFERFVINFKTVFNQGSGVEAAALRLLNFKQGKRSMADYSIDFWILAEETGWGPDALRSTLLNNIREDLKDELIMRDLPTAFDELMSLCIKVDERLRARRQARNSSSQEAAGPRWAEASADLPVLPDIRGRRRRERQRRITAGECLYCGNKGHMIASCPSRAKGRAPLPAKLLVHSECHSLSVLIDSGAEQNFIDSELAKRLCVTVESLPHVLRITALSGQRLPDITHITEPLTLTLSGNHSEEISFFVFHSTQTPLVLGHPWLQQHNPTINWQKGGITGWGEECHMTCLKAAVPPNKSVTGPEPPRSSDLADVPSVYHDLAEVFRKDRAQSLPPHRPYDCAIDLLPGAPLPTSRLYSLSLPEREAMEKYITESLAAGIIRASSSPVAAGFFFVEKKDKTLRPCIDFRGLNNITVKNKYPLPLLTSAFELLQGAVIFSKLDLRNAYHLVRIRDGDEWKTAFNTHLGHFEYLVMPFDAGRCVKITQLFGGGYGAAPRGQQVDEGKWEAGPSVR